MVDDLTGFLHYPWQLSIYHSDWALPHQWPGESLRNNIGNPAPASALTSSECVAMKNQCVRTSDFDPLPD